MRIAVLLVALFAVVFGVVGVFTPDSLTLRAVGAVALVGGLVTPLFGVERHRPLTFAVLRRFSRVNILFAAEDDQFLKEGASRCGPQASMNKIG